MTSHVFIVDRTTLKFHLEYLFAGTGAQENIIDFNNSTDTDLHHKTENVLVEMIADASRIRQGDLIIFYLQQNIQQKILEGKFYGIFRAKHDWSFLDNNDQHQYLKNDLQKSLTFRTLIEPFRVYAEGVTEWEALDEIKDIHCPNQMLWSLIYRKLKGKRGNTMITIYESERLCQLIRNKNDKIAIELNDGLLSFDVNNQKIISMAQPRNRYEGISVELNILPRLISKYERNQSFEAHLQAYIVKNIGKGVNITLDTLLLDNAPIEWLGNEVYCGVGMQKIDVMLGLIQKEQRIIIPIELKSTRANVNIIRQIQRYVDWINQYYIPNRQSDIQPILVSKRYANRNTRSYQKFIEGIKQFNELNKPECKELKYIEFTLQDGDLVFQQVSYQ